jgi:hypothetical protein
MLFGSFQLIAFRWQLVCQLIAWAVVRRALRGRSAIAITIRIAFATASSSSAAATARTALVALWLRRAAWRQQLVLLFQPRLGGRWWAQIQITGFVQFELGFLGRPEEVGFIVLLKSRRLRLRWRGRTFVSPATPAPTPASAATTTAALVPFTPASFSFAALAFAKAAPRRTFLCFFGWRRLLAEIQVAVAFDFVIQHKAFIVLGVAQGRRRRSFVAPRRLAPIGRQLARRGAWRLAMG